jgi:DNA/RNA-binding domain of Phe-tRNA-synthetase-like protein
VIPRADQFPEDPANPIILDWKGKFATAYSFEEDKANILVFDTSATLQHQLAVTEIDSEKLHELADVLSTLLRRPGNTEISEEASPGPD